MLSIRKTVIAIALSAAILVVGCDQLQDITEDFDARVSSRVPSTDFLHTWAFGVMGDTQWPTDDGKNPNTVAVGIIDQVNREFINRRVKFVIQVGDLTDNGTVLAMDTRATYAQALYNARIGFFPMRGNHEGEDSGYVADSAAAREFQRIYPQTQKGHHNATPRDAFITTTDNIQLPPKRGSVFTTGTNFSTPGNVQGIGDLTGLSYSFDYRNARFVILDQFTPADAAADGLGAIAPQQEWITSALTGRDAGTHAFVFSHKGIITENHVDTLLSNNVNLDPTSNPSQNPAATDVFIDSLFGNSVRYFIGGHDHMHNRALVSDTKGTVRITDLIVASCSYKFYTPATPSHDEKYDVPSFGVARETPLGQDLYRIGYYIFTVKGPAVTVDYYASDLMGTPAAPGKNVTISATPTLTFTKRDSFGYSLNGQEFIVAQGASYSVVSDIYDTTTAAILDGTNSSTQRDGSGRTVSKAVNTGWTDRFGDLYSDILTLWGMTEQGKATTDIFVLSMSYDDDKVSNKMAKTGCLGIATPGDKKWVNVVSGNTGGTKMFVVGPYTSGYGLGTYGVDLTTHTFWAVLNFTGDFAVAPGVCQ